MKRLRDQVILVTGATDGIGRGVSLGLARMGATVLLHGRDPARLRVTREDIAAATGSNRLEAYRADFGALAEVRRLADEVQERHESLDVLINNAGLGTGRRGERRREVSADAYELRLQVNHLAPFLLEHLLLPVLHQASPARIVNVASGAQAPIDFENIMLERGYDSFRAYSQSKLAMVIATLELAERLDPKQVTANCLHPGSLLDTKMVREGWGPPMGPVEIGIESEIYVASSSDLEGVTGQYFDQTRRARAHPQAYDADIRRRLWAISEALTGLQS